MDSKKSLEQQNMEKKSLVTGLLAHVDAGKTTLAEAILYTTGQVRSLGRVDHQDCFLDTDSIERARGITIFSKEAHATYHNVELTLLDTPGHVDFSAEMERALSVIDLGILVVSGSDGVQGHTNTLWKLLERYQIPTILFVNKMDQPQANHDEILSSIQKKLSGNIVEFVHDKTEEFYENLSVCDEELLEEYLENACIEKESIVDAISERKVFPVIFGSALHLEEIDTLLSIIEEYAPVPEYPEEFAARVFKITRDDSGKRMTHMKITGGTLLPKQILSNENHLKEGEEIWQEKVDQLRRYDGTRFIPLSEAKAGEIVAVTGLTKTFAGEGLGEETVSEETSLEPVLEYSLILPEGVDAAQALPKLKMLEEEDPKLHIVYQEQGKEIHIQVMGQIQTQILKDKIKERFDMDISFGNGRIVYKETILTPSYGIGHFEPLRHYAECQLLLEPGERGSGIQFATLCSEDLLNKNWQRLIRTHVEETIHPGVLTRSEVTDLRVILMTGKAHPKHTEGGDFRQATYRAIRNGLRKAQNVLLEPVYRFTMEVPTECVGRAMTDIEKLYGNPEPPQMEGDICILSGKAPVSTFKDYQLELQAYTAGRGRLSLVPDGYMPCHNTEEVVEHFGYDPEADVRRPTGSVFCAHGAGFQVPWDEVASMAHMECPLDMDEVLEHWTKRTLEENPEKEELTNYIKLGKSAEQPDIPLSGAKVRKSSDFISVEEIDAIMNSTFRQSGGDSGHYRRYHRGSKNNRKYGQTNSQKLAGAGGTQSGENTYIPPKKVEAPKKRYFLVDGYNIIFAWKELKDLAQNNIDSARDKLIDICCDYQGYTQDTLILVYDAYKVKGNMGSEYKHHNIYVVYTKEAETADAYIEKTTRELAGKNHVTVATSDGLEQMIIWGNGAYRMSAREFEEAYRDSHNKMKESYLNKESKLSNNPFGNIKIADEE